MVGGVWPKIDSHCDKQEQEQEEEEEEGEGTGPSLEYATSAARRSAPCQKKICLIFTSCKLPARPNGVGDQSGKYKEFVRF